MSWKHEWKPLLVIVAVFLACFWLPVGGIRFDTSILEALHLVKWYAQEHVLLCLIPAFFIAGAIATFVSQASVMRYLGAEANKVLAYSVAAVSGTILAVCSCTVLPLFAGIYRRGAGLGPATAFLYSGPAINVLAIILTARVLGLELGAARAVGAIVFSVVIGLLMHAIFRNDPEERVKNVQVAIDEKPARSLYQDALYFASMVGILVFANWARPAEPGGLWSLIYAMRWLITGVFALGLGVILIAWFRTPWWQIALSFALVLILAALFPRMPMIPFAGAILSLAILTSTSVGELNDWFSSSWGFAKQILPLLLLGVLVAGVLLGRPGHEGLIPGEWVNTAVGGNSIRANLFASVAGAFMYFATLTEVPILQGLLGNGMGKGPALALLLAGPALSLPNMLVIRSVIGTKKTVVYVTLVVVMATVSGILYGLI
ncbi:MAG: permease [Candidatus Eisenbacteria bacterium]|uniref:Permease n=1 Tax=Eiseniibacteriota bacterium TaxID=2212470 RepID=A0A948W5H0_UNCEI|nr:permease [Candidatus Eisenbacteria bacterium]MBU1949420.1 permease [Candidatus Eisenbacteria bacterium]MBU2689576.1 permease [Candidatus Eisenbacteria bacterium]